MDAYQSHYSSKDGISSHSLDRISNARGLVSTSSLNISTQTVLKSIDSCGKLENNIVLCTAYGMISINIMSIYFVMLVLLYTSSLMDSIICSIPIYRTPFTYLQ